MVVRCRTEATTESHRIRDPVDSAASGAQAQEEGRVEPVQAQRVRRQPVVLRCRPGAKAERLARVERAEHPFRRVRR